MTNREKIISLLQTDADIAKDFISSIFNSDLFPYIDFSKFIDSEEKELSSFLINTIPCSITPSEFDLRMAEINVEVNSGLDEFDRDKYIQMHTKEAYKLDEKTVLGMDYFVCYLVKENKCVTVPIEEVVFNR